MKILVIGAGRIGSEVLKQLKKNEKLQIVVADPSERPDAVMKGLIDRVDVLVHITPLNFEEIVDEIAPDLVVLTRTAKDWEQHDIHMGSQFVCGMERELTKYKIPVIPASEQILGPC